MDDVDLGAFAALFKQACIKGCGQAKDEPLTETESRLLYTRIFEDTGLVVGWKSIKNYSLFLSASTAKPENPSVATLDTLARFVLGAPYTTEPERKKEAGHYPYWYSYRAQWLGQRPAGTGSGRRGLVAGIAGMVLLGIAAWIFVNRTGEGRGFSSDFHSVAGDLLAREGWLLLSQDEAFWERRGELPGCLTLFTLKGDNWPDPANRPVIRNLLMHPISCDCFTLELHLKDFIPYQNWQQAGILLAEDTGLTGKSLRVSIAYNDYNGVYPRTGEVLLQAILSRGSGEGKPEEIAHIPLFSADSLRRDPLLARHLGHTAIRIEKRGNRFRILYADGILENTSFREIVSHEFIMQPRYAGLFAIKGYVDSAAEMPVHISYFGLSCCDR